jgi:hypothetical protein
LQFDLGIGEASADGQSTVLSGKLQSAAAQPFTVLYKEQPVGRFAILCRDVFCNSLIYAHDAPREQVWERKCVLQTDFGV